MARGALAGGGPAQPGILTRLPTLSLLPCSVAGQRTNQFLASARRPAPHWHRGALLRRCVARALGSLCRQGRMGAHTLRDAIPARLGGVGLPLRQPQPGSYAHVCLTPFGSLVSNPLRFFRFTRMASWLNFARFNFNVFLLFFLFCRALSLNCQSGKRAVKIFRQCPEVHPVGKLPFCASIFFFQD